MIRAVRVDTAIMVRMLISTCVCKVLRPFLRPDDRILMLGCGRSDMPQQMYRDGYLRITNVDISQHLLDRHAAQKSMDRAPNCERTEGLRRNGRRRCP